MEWTREQRYQKLGDETNSIIGHLKLKVDNCPYRQKFHIQPNTGLLNDPNGFSYYNGEYHLFYQWFPLGPVHGVKYWYHLSSKNLIEWKDCGVALEPIEMFNSHGVFSGSGIVYKNKLNLMYTGNVRDDYWNRTSYQCIATMDEKGKIQNNRSVINEIPKGYTENFRDPKIFEKNDKFYCLIGAETEKKSGTVVYYESENLEKWDFKGEIKTEFKNSGFMWECPDYFEIENKAVMIISPQGMQAQGDEFNNIFQSGYLIGTPIDFKDGIFYHGKFSELDRGFEFYAPQTMKAPDGRQILIAWMGLPGIETVSAENGWAHCMTIPREIRINDNKLIQTPIRELQMLRKEHFEVKAHIKNQEKQFPNISGKTFEMLCTFSEFHGNKLGIKLRKGQNTEMIFSYDIENKKLTLDRSKSGRLTDQEYGDTRACKFDNEVIKIQIFSDESSIEIFVNDGEEVFTTRIFAEQDSQEIIFYADGEAYMHTDFWQY